MKLLFNKESLWILLLPLVLLLLLFAPQPANAQTDPTATPDSYPPPATPVQPGEAYPLDRPETSSSEAEEGYIPPTVPPVATNPREIIGERAQEATAVATLPISQSTLVRNRMVLWAGFLVTLFIFGLAVYGAMIMYTRSRS
ncbi:MAG: hypothetical protein DHS20C20_33980 [Ardenticatenaceae bacterium]|nr:MAG: hypothetical protein DHS20C20_33980 [Ardenticatenaceae bacterium]